MEYNSNENVIIYCKDGHSNIKSGIMYQYLEDITQKKVIILIEHEQVHKIYRVNKMTSILTLGGQ